MPAHSAGILIHRGVGADVQVLLAHPGGPFWRGRNVGAWQIPKGLVEPGEDAAAAALREVHEELGLTVDGPLVPLGRIRQAGGKVVVAFGTEADFDPASIISNTIEIDWPPRSGRKLTIPEIDEAKWFGLDDARHYILSSQAPLLDRLQLHLAQLPSVDT